jgi:hypothetical protein
VGPEPLTWIGTSDQIGEDGRVKTSYPARHFTTASGTWGWGARKTSDFTHGAAVLFDRDDFGADYMKGMAPWPSTPEDQNELFFRVGAMLNDAFAFAHRLGVKTCLGTETPLLIPVPLKARPLQAGKNPDDPAVVQELYEGASQFDFEYFDQVVTDKGQTLHFLATAPVLNQTVVVVQEN